MIVNKRAETLWCWTCVACPLLSGRGSTVHPTTEAISKGLGTGRISTRDKAQEELRSMAVQEAARALYYSSAYERHCLPSAVTYMPYPPPAATIQGPPLYPALPTPVAAAPAALGVLTSPESPVWLHAGATATRPPYTWPQQNAAASDGVFSASTTTSTSTTSSSMSVSTSSSS